MAGALSGRQNGNGAVRQWPVQFHLHFPSRRSRTADSEKSGGLRKRFLPEAEPWCSKPAITE
jgi:hypothetical protein